MKSIKLGDLVPCIHGNKYIMYMPVKYDYLLPYDGATENTVNSQGLTSVCDVFRELMSFLLNKSDRITKKSRNEA